MNEAIEHLEAALGILEPMLFDARIYFDKLDKKRTSKLAPEKFQAAWTRYRTLTDMVNFIGDALVLADTQAKK